MRDRTSWAWRPTVFAILIACSATADAESAPRPRVPIQILDGPTLTMDPNGFTPLAGVVELATDVPVRCTLTISDGTDPRTIEFPGFGAVTSLPVLGLRPNRSYTVDLRLTAEDGATLDVTPAMQAVTDPLPADFPVISVVTSDPASMEPGYTLLDHISRGQNAPGTTYTIILDESGRVVWYSTLSLRPVAQLPRPMTQLPNGSLLFYGIEHDMLGNAVSTPLTPFPPGLGLHHEFYPSSRRTWLSIRRELVPVTGYPTSDADPGAPTQTVAIEDNPVVEFHRDGSLLGQWNLSDILDPTRIAYGGALDLRPTGGLNWAHANAVIDDPSDDTFIVSSRAQDTVVKFSRLTGEPKWILAPHANWSPEYQPYLLQPVGIPFEWQYHQHAPMITDSGTLVLFDNGNYRASPFDGTTPQDPADSYSRAVEYSIDEQAMTVSQVWEYGGSASAVERLYSPSVGDADALPVTGNVLIVFGNVAYVDGVSSADLGFGRGHARIIEVDRNIPSRKVFDVIVYNPDTPQSRIVVYRADRIPTLYRMLWDEDGDGLANYIDNCLDTANPAQTDSDGDAIGNACDPDIAPSQNDCVVDFRDLGALRDALASTPGSANWNPDADLDDDGSVGFSDVEVMKAFFFTRPGPSGFETACLP